MDLQQLLERLPVKLSLGGGATPPNKLAILLDDEWVFWHFTSEGTRRCLFEDFDEQDTILRISDQDVVVTPGTAKGKRLRSRILNEVKADYVSIAQSKLIYATAKKHIYQGGYRVAPIACLIDFARQDAGLTPPCVIGAKIGEGDNSLAIAWPVRSTGAISPPEIVAGHDESDLRSAVAGAIEHGGLSDDDMQTVWLSSTDLFATAQKHTLPSYPVPEELHGIPKVQLAGSAVVVTALFAAYAGYGYWSQYSKRTVLKSTYQQLAAQASLRGQIEDEVKGHIHTFVKAMHLDVEGALDAVYTLYRPDTKARLDIQRSNVSTSKPSGVEDSTVVVRVEKSQASEFSSGSLGHSTRPWMSKRGLEAVLETDPPDGWQVQSMDMSANGLNLKVTYEKRS